MANEGQVVNSGSSMSAAQMLLRLTGAATLAAGALLYGDGDASLATLAPGTNGHVLTLAGGLPSWAAIPSTGLPGSYAVGDLLYASGASTLAKLAAVATGNALISGGVTTAPAWGKIGLTTHVSGILPSANGGTGVNNAGTITTAANISFTGAGSFVTGGFTLTIPATGTVGLLGAANAWTQTNGFQAVTATTIGGTVITATTRLVGVSAPSGSYGIETSAGIRGDRTSTDSNGTYAYDYRRIANTTASGTHHARAMSGSTYGTIATGQTNGGGWTGAWTEVLRNYVVAGDTGTLATLMGFNINFGHFNTDASTPTTTTVKGLALNRYASSGTIGTMYGIHIDNGSLTVTPTTAYGIKVESTFATTAYAIHSEAGRVYHGDVVQIAGNSNLPAATGGALTLAGAQAGSVAGSIYYGDGSGWSLKFRTRTGSADTDRLTLTDGGLMTIHAATGITLTISSTDDAAITSSGGATLKRATLTHGAITTDVKTLDSTVTWNAAGVAFTGWKLNVTNTASAAASLLLDLQVGSSSVANVNKFGHIALTNAGLTAAANVIDVTQTFNAAGSVFKLFRSAVTLTAAGTSFIFDLAVGPATFQVLTTGLLNHNCILSATSSITEMVNVVARTSGTAAAGFGLAEAQYLHDDGGTPRLAGYNSVEWVSAATASRAARIIHKAYDTAARECLRLEASGSAAMIGFLGAAAVARATMAAATGSATRTTFDTTTVTTAQLAERVKALIDDFRSYGLHG
jgi:hypothetical protein